MLIGDFAKEGHHYMEDPYPAKALKVGKKVDSIIPSGERIAVNDFGKPIKL
jgi:hypothetical protein